MLEESEVMSIRQSPAVFPAAVASIGIRQNRKAVRRLFLRLLTTVCRMANGAVTARSFAQICRHSVGCSDAMVLCALPLDEHVGRRLEVRL